jgi:membrane protein implicated in regulation of membrane protease activity
MSHFADWWAALSPALKFYWIIAIPFTLFFVLQLILSFVGGGDVPDDAPDVEIETDTGVPFQFFTLKNLVAFFTIFAWTGIACIDSGFSETTAAIVAVLAGLLMMIVMASLFYFLAKANADGTMKFRKAVGKSGQVYLPIAKSRGGTGQVQIKVQGSLRTLDAVTDDDRDIATGTIVKVVSIINENVLVVSSK